MRLKAIATILFCIPFFPACEQQKWSETKMFHEVPKQGGDAHGKAADAHAAAPAHSTEKAAEHK